MPGSVGVFFSTVQPISAGCNDVLQAFQAQFDITQYVFHRCGSDPVELGTLVYIYNIGNGRSDYYPLTTFTGFAPLEGVDMVVNCTVSPCQITHELQSPFNLSLDEGGAIATAIILVWALGFGIRMVIRAMRSDESPLSEND